MESDRGDNFHFTFEPSGIPIVKNQKEICHDDHIPFNLKGTGNLFL